METMAQIRNSVRPVKLACGAHYRRINMTVLDREVGILLFRLRLKILLPGLLGQDIHWRN